MLIFATAQAGRPKWRGGHWRLRYPSLKYTDIQPVKKKVQGQIMIWGAISIHGPGPLALVRGTMDSAQYVRILKQNLIPYILELEEESEDIRYFEDNDPKHTSNMTKEFYANNDTRKDEWPSTSPDLNPMENVWSELDKLMFKHIPRFTPQNEVYGRIKVCWNMIPVEHIQKCINSMPR